jgi:hypothetical protein
MFLNVFWVIFGMAGDCARIVDSIGNKAATKALIKPTKHKFWRFEMLEVSNLIPSSVRPRDELRFYGQ